MTKVALFSHLLRGRTDVVPIPWKGKHAAVRRQRLDALCRGGVPRPLRACHEGGLRRAHRCYGYEAGGYAARLGCLPGPSPAWPPAWLTTAAAPALSSAAPARPPRPSQGPNAAGSARQRPAQGPTASPALAPARHRRLAKPPVARALHQRCTSVNCGAFATRGASWFCRRRYFYKTFLQNRVHDRVQNGLHKPKTPHWRGL
jgi:hypothetical protein